MKSFELVPVEIFDDSLEEMVSSEMLKVTEGDKVWWVTPHSSSRRWAEYLRYRAWVEAGNSPEDFWLSDGNEPEIINNEV